MGRWALMGPLHEEVEAGEENVGGAKANRRSSEGSSPQHQGPNASSASPIGQMLMRSSADVSGGRNANLDELRTAKSEIFLAPSFHCAVLSMWSGSRVAVLQKEFLAEGAEVLTDSRLLI
ncbi:hypothetical protein NQZ68_013154 [Dissostichus eleginoides]|nr:hypothetical protein NQZ68_013154 [Dissostichus eleginoides]